MTSRDRVSQALHDAGAVLIRSGKHLIYRLPNGQNVVVSHTPSDYRAEANKLRDIRHALAKETRV